MLSPDPSGAQMAAFDFDLQEPGQNLVTKIWSVINTKKLVDDWDIGWQ